MVVLALKPHTLNHTSIFAITSIIGDIFHGTFCPNSRSCQHLVNCINTAKEAVRATRDRVAFLQYLDVRLHHVAVLFEDC